MGYCNIKPLHSMHNRGNLSSVLLEVLKGHGITNQILSITTDNASNNNTIMIQLQELIQSQDISSDTTII
jgi:hypothetical protein